MKVACLKSPLVVSGGMLSWVQYFWATAVTTGYFLYSLLCPNDFILWDKKLFLFLFRKCCWFCWEVVWFHKCALLETLECVYVGTTFFPLKCCTFFVMLILLRWHWNLISIFRWMRGTLNEVLKVFRLNSTQYQERGKKYLAVCFETRCLFLNVSYSNIFFFLSISL